MKLNVLLAKTDNLATQYFNLLRNYIDFFKKSQGAFRGEKKTYQANAGTIDEPKLRGNTLITTTVDEKLQYFDETTGEYIDSLFSLERTNSSGAASADLVVDGIVWGNFTTLELLRLKSLLEHGDLLSMYSNIPVRSDAEEWSESDNEMYLNRGVYETPLLEGVKKTTEKESYIIEDPNIGKLKTSSAYTPQIGQKNTVVELGKFTFQRFSGEWSQREKAEVLRRRTTLLTAVITALKEANEVEAEASALTAGVIFGYLHGK